MAALHHERRLMTLRTKASTIVLLPLAAMGAVTFAAATPAGASSKSTTVTAVETNFHIALSQSSFKPGTYTFVAENKGQSTHALEITGPGLHNAKTKDLGPGQSAKLKVTFKKGKYDVYCPIPGHKALGMNVNLVVSSTGGAAKTTTQTTKASGGYGY
jgi:plastocyanin